MSTSRSVKPGLWVLTIEVACLLAALFSGMALAQAETESAPAAGSGLRFFEPAPEEAPPEGAAPPGGEPETRQEARRENEEEEEEEEEEGHAGMLSRLGIGIGYGLYGGSGQADPVPGVEVIEDPSGGGLALNLQLDWGLGIIENLALHVGPLFEVWLVGDHDSSIDGLYLFGLGGGISYYFMPLDLYLTGQIRWFGTLFYLPDAPCEFLGTSKLYGWDGVGFSLQVGKEWFPGDNDGGLGIGLQIKYAYLDEAPGINYFSIMLMPTVTRF